MSQRKKLIHLNTSGSSAPDSSLLNYGEIAIAYGKGHETLFIKNTEDNIVSFGVTNDVLTNYYTKSQVDDKITEVVTSGSVSLDGYATEEWVESKNYATKTDIPSLDGYAKTSDIPSLDGYATKDELGGYTTDAEFESLTDAVALKANSSDLTDYAKKTDIPNLDGYATEEWVESKNYATKSDIPTDYVTDSELTNYYTKSQVDTKITEVVTSGSVSLDGYATEEWVENQNYAKKSEIPSLDGYAKISDIPTDYVTDSDLTDYYTKSEVEAKITEVVTSGSVSLDGYATEEWVESKNYATKSEIPTDYVTDSDLTDYAKKSDIPSLDGYATEEWVENQNYAKKSEIPSLDGYATKDELSGYTTDAEFESLTDAVALKANSSDLTDYAKKSDIPSLDSYATEEWVESQNYAKKSDIPSLDGYAKTSDIPSLDGYATKDELSGYTTDAEFESLTDAVALKANSSDLTDYAKKSDIPSLDGYATEEWVESKNYATKSEIPTDYVTDSDLTDYAKKSEIPTNISEFTNDVNYVTETELVNQQYVTKSALNDYLPINYITTKKVVFKGNCYIQHNPSNTANTYVLTVQTNFTKTIYDTDGNITISNNSTDFITSGTKLIVDKNCMILSIKYGLYSYQGVILTRGNIDDLTFDNYNKSEGSNAIVDLYNINELIYEEITGGKEPYLYCEIEYI